MEARIQLRPFDFSAEGTFIVYARDAEADDFSAYTDLTDFSDVLNGRLSNTIPAADVKIAAMQKTVSIPSGQSSHLRIIRGVAESESDVNDLLAECRNLRFIDLQPFVEDE